MDILVFWQIGNLIKKGCNTIKDDIVIMWDINLLTAFLLRYQSFAQNCLKNFCYFFILHFFMTEKGIMIEVT